MTDKVNTRIEATTTTPEVEMVTVANVEISKEVAEKQIIQAVKKRKRVVNYLNNKDMMIQVIESHRIGKMTDELAKMLTLLTKRYGSRANLVNYTYNDDMQAYAMMMFCRTWKNFNPEKYNNPFAYYTQCIKNCFRQYLVSEKKHRNIRDKSLVAIGMTPSHTYQLEQGSGSEFRAFQFDEVPANNDYEVEYEAGFENY